MKWYRDMLSLEKAKSNSFTNIVIVALDVFAISINDKIDCHMKDTQNITKENKGQQKVDTKFAK